MRSLAIVIVTSLYFFFVLPSFAVDKNEVPLFGDQPKSEAETLADKKFVKEALAAAGTISKASDHLIARGWEALGKGDISTAIKRFNQVYLLDPSDYRAYWGLAAAVGEQRKYTDALKLFERAESIKRDDARLLSDHGFALVSLGLTLLPDENSAIEKFIAAEKLYRKAIGIAPKEALPLSRLAILMYYKGDLKQSLDLVKKSQSLGGEGLDPRFLNDLAAADRKQ